MIRNVRKDKTLMLKKITQIPVFMRYFPRLSRPALGPTQPPVQWLSCLSSPGGSGRGVELTTHPF
jgi:hypothetical protein